MSKSLLEPLKIPLCAFASIMSCGYLSMFSMPYLIGSMVDYLQVPESTAGLLGTAELIVVAVTTAILAPRMDRLPRRSLAAAGMLIAATGHFLSMSAAEPLPLLAVRALAGLGAGLALAAGNAVIAGTGDPLRNYARMIAVYGALGAGLLIGMGFAVSLWGLPGAYAVQGLWVVLTMPFLLFMPMRLEAKASEQVSGARIPWGAGALGVAAVFLWHSCDTSVYGFSERVAAAIGFDPEETGWVLGASVVTGFLGASLASLLGDRFGRVWPILTGGVAFALCSYVLTAAESADAYISAQVAYALFFTFTGPYIYGIVGDLDRHGRVMVAASSAALFGGGVGPYLSSLVAEAAGYGAIGEYVVGIVALILLFSLVCLRISRAASGAQPTTMPAQPKPTVLD